MNRKAWDRDQWNGWIGAASPRLTKEIEEEEEEKKPKKLDLRKWSVCLV